VEVPGSKSINNRALLLAALARGESRVSNVLLSDDTMVFVEALKALGFQLDFDLDQRVCRIAGGGGALPASSGAIWCGSAGTAARFLLAAVAAAGRGEYRFDATAQMRARPIGPLIKGLVAQGATVRTSPGGSFPITLKTDGLVGGHLHLTDGDQSSQYLSAMLMAAPLAHQPVEIETALSVSRPYADMTVRMMSDFGVEVDRTDYSRFVVPAPVQYRGRDYVIEADASTASYFFAAAALSGGTVRVAAVSRRDSLQGDVRFLDILEAMGCVVVESADGVAVTGPRELRGVTVDMSDISDTVMTLAAIAPFASTPTTIENIGHIRLKESDRIAAVATNLERIGIRAEVGDSFLRIYPGQPRGATIDSYGDHRIAMSFSVVGLVVPEIGISDPESVTKTCPEFYDILDKLY
jgi:3-phosphoshikimate 1-carboxyvinyltransferase